MGCCHCDSIYHKALTGSQGNASATLLELPGLCAKLNLFLFFYTHIYNWPTHKYFVTATTEVDQWRNHVFAWLPPAWHRDGYVISKNLWKQWRIASEIRWQKRQLQFAVPTTLSPPLSLTVLYLSILHMASHFPRSRQLPHLAPLGSLGGESPRLASSAHRNRDLCQSHLIESSQKQSPQVSSSCRGPEVSAGRLATTSMKAPMPARTSLNCSWLLSSSRILHNKKIIFILSS